MRTPATRKKRLLTAAILTACLAVFYVLARYVLFGLHGMKDWPTVLAAASLGILAASLLMNARATSVLAVAGYPIGFLIGLLFHTYGVDQGGGRTNNLWKIWTIALLVCIAIGIALDTLQKIRRAKGRAR